MNLSLLLDAGFSAGTPFRRLDLPRRAVRAGRRAGSRVLRIDPAVLRRLALEAFRDVNFLFRTSHLSALAAILEDPSSSENDRFVAAALLKNAAISSELVLPACQDTGTATVIGLKGEGVTTGADDEEWLSRGVADAYASYNLRFSQVAPVSMREDEDTRTNLPAQIDLAAAPSVGPGGDQYRFLFIAKGGGSANKTRFFQETRGVLQDEAFDAFLRDKIRSLGTAACPPYHLAVVVGGTSAEQNLKYLKLATAGALDALPTRGPWPFRDPAWEERALGHARESGLGAQFGGRHLVLDARVIRLARHAASVPISVGVSCCAHRNAYGFVDARGAWLEELDRNPSRFLSRALSVLSRSLPAAPRIDLGLPMAAVRSQLSGKTPGTLILLSGPMVVARDAAHARIARQLADTGELPAWIREHPVYYAGPAQTPPGHLIGSFGPTTAQRMDPYVRSFMAAGGSLVMVGKGNRSEEVAAACREFGGFFLGTIGGAGALIAKENVVSEEVLAWPELGMEAVRLISVRELPAFVVIDDKGGSLYR